MEMELQRPSKLMEERLAETKRLQEARDAEEAELASSGKGRTFWIPINDGMQAAAQAHKRTASGPASSSGSSATRLDANHNHVVVSRRASFKRGGVSGGTLHRSVDSSLDSGGARTLEEGTVVNSATFTRKSSSFSNRITRSSGTWDLAAGQQQQQLRRQSDASSSSTMSSTVSAPCRQPYQVHTQVSSNDAQPPSPGAQRCPILSPRAV